jgi:hypothetical protein
MDNWQTLRYPHVADAVIEAALGLDAFRPNH